MSSEANEFVKKVGEGMNNIYYGNKVEASVDKTFDDMVERSYIVKQLTERLEKQEEQIEQLRHCLNHTK